MASPIPECSICTEEYNTEDCKPLILSCGHGFCARCIAGILEGNPRCPECRTPISQRSITDLVVNRDLMRLLPGASPASSSASDQSLCAQCQKKAAPVFCEDCERSYCRTCSGFLHSTALSHHKLVSAQERNPRAHCPICPQHHKPQDTLCVQCRCLACSVCLPEHKSHELLNYDKWAPNALLRNLEERVLNCNYTDDHYFHDPHLELELKDVMHHWAGLSQFFVVPFLGSSSPFSPFSSLTHSLDRPDP